MTQLRKLLTVLLLLPACAHADSAPTSSAAPTLNPADDIEMAQELAPHDAKVCSPKGVALGGYDAVAYHTEDAAIKGDADITASYDELTYRFNSAENLALFEKDPEQYLPHFRGWCAIALARNRLTCPDYKNFKVEDGKLLLFETIAFTNGRNVWDSNPIENLISAEQNFRRLLAL